jgi:hypothetical protein
MTELNCPVCNKTMKFLSPEDDRHPMYKCESCKYKWQYDKESKTGQWIKNKWNTSIFENQLQYIEQMKKASPLANQPQATPHTESEEVSYSPKTQAIGQSLQRAVEYHCNIDKTPNPDKVLETANLFLDWWNKKLNNGHDKPKLEQPQEPKTETTIDTTKPKITQEHQDAIINLIKTKHKTPQAVKVKLIELIGDIELPKLPDEKALRVIEILEAEIFSEVPK